MGNLSRENIINCYDAIDEDNRLTFNNVRQVEYFTNLHYLKEYVKPGMCILDCACGTGAYIFDLLSMGGKVFASDLTPSHIKKLNAKLKERNIISVKTEVCDATNLSMYPNEFFDVVLCMGPLYHLLSEQEQELCINECRKKTKLGGVIFFSYLNRCSIFPYIVKSNKSLLTQQNIDSFFTKKRTVYNKDPFCFFTDSYYHIPEEIESIMIKGNLKKEKHIGMDGPAYDFEEYVNGLSNDEFQLWMKYHFYICEQSSMLGISQHGLFIAKKE